MFSSNKFPSLWQLCDALVPPTIWAMIIYILSAQQVLPGFETNLADFLFKKIAHMSVYAILYLLTWRAVRVLKLPLPRHLIWSLPLMICVLYSISDEWHQSFVAGRTATFRDLGFDFLGALSALLKKYDYI